MLNSNHIGHFMDSLFQNALTFFLVTNPIGNSPTILALVKDFSFKDQQRIILREALFSLIVALCFQYLGELFLNMLNIETYAVTLCGGLLLFLLSLQMIFAIAKQNETTTALKQEPFIVPVATPLLAGPGLLTIIMLTSKMEQNNLRVTLSLVIAWIGVFVVMAVAPYLQRLLGRRGMLALEQFMGMLLAIISMGMIVQGINLFLDTLK